MAKKFYISDTHFGHSNVIQFDHRLLSGNWWKIMKGSTAKMNRLVLKIRIRMEIWMLRRTFQKMQKLYLKNEALLQEAKKLLS